MKPETRSCRESLETLARETAGAAGLLLVDFEFVENGRETVVRLYVDREGGVTVDECSRLSRKLGRELDERDLMPCRYRLEVSSPGVERPFRCREQYEWSVGKRVRVTFREPMDDKRNHEGVLAEVREDGIVLGGEGDGGLFVPFSDIEEACRVLVF